MLLGAALQAAINRYLGEHKQTQTLRLDRQTRSHYREGQSRVPRDGSLVPDKPSIAVLPFANLSGDPEQQYFADGTVEEIITALSRTRWLL
jgi:TolB-like protein